MGLGTWNRIGRWWVLGLVHHLDGDPVTANPYRADRVDAEDGEN